MDDIMSLLVGFTIIYTAIIILTIFLLNKFYRTELVLGKKIKETEWVGTYNYVEQNSPYHINSYFSFVTKDNKKKVKTTRMFSSLKIGKTKYLLYNFDKDKIVGKVYTIIWQLLLFALNILYLCIIGLPYFIIAVLLVVITFLLYKKSYNKKILKNDIDNN